VDAPALQKKVITLLKAQDQRRHFEMSDTIEAVVLEATLALSRDGRERAYVREIAAEVNRRREARGEAVRLSPEKVGHRLKKLGLRTRPLLQTGNGLTFDKATVAGIQRLAVMHGMEDMPAED
jgi:predicted transposase YdaD